VHFVLCLWITNKCTDFLAIYYFILPLVYVSTHTCYHQGALPCHTYALPSGSSFVSHIRVTIRELLHVTHKCYHQGALPCHTYVLPSGSSSVSHIRVIIRELFCACWVTCESNAMVDKHCVMRGYVEAWYAPICLVTLPVGNVIIQIGAYQTYT
jgi:hypothetical protein